ncbi:PotD/PotF family extracellular solute-binding protein [Streptomyces sp. NPDC012623]|uniref:ABC transporter substrate-binding protein n=1 Tax=unclassified Streptomyces TaxID=2593676 RepID=UPI0036C85987
MRSVLPRPARARRRGYLLALASAGTATVLTAVAGCGVDTGGGSSSGSGSSDGKGEQITVTAFAGAWGDLFKKSFVEPFEKDTGIKVNLVYGADSDWVTKLRAAGGRNAPFDVVALTPGSLHQAVGGGLLQPLKTGDLSNWKQLDPVLTQQSTVDGSSYGVPLTTGSNGLLYRTDKIKQAPQDWTDIFDKKYCGHVALPPLTYNAGLEFFSALVSQDGGKLSDPADVDKGFEKLAQLKNCVSSYPADAGSVSTVLQNGDAWIVPFWDGRAFAMEQEGQPIGFTYPASGAVGALTSYYVPKGSTHTAAAYKFLDHLSSAEHQKPFAEGTFYGAGNDTIDYAPDFKAKVKYGEDVYKKFTWVDYKTATPKLNEWQQRWNQIFK